MRAPTTWGVPELMPRLREPNMVIQIAPTGDTRIHIATRILSLAYSGQNAMDELIPTVISKDTLRVEWLV